MTPTGHHTRTYAPPPVLLRLDGAPHDPRWVAERCEYLASVCIDPERAAELRRMAEDARGQIRRG